jgi:hypothetical protein
MAKAVAKLEEAQASVPAVRENTMIALLDRIMSDPTMPMERINQAFDFYQRVSAEQARKSFDAALAAAQARFPAITKNRRVQFEGKGSGSKGTDYYHEDLAELVEKCGPILAEEGITRKWRTKNAPNEPITVTCILKHVDGHFEETTLCGPSDDSGNKNSLQRIASTITYLERYTFKSAIGVASQHDDDGKAAGIRPAETLSEDALMEVNRLLAATKSNVPIFLALFDVEAAKDMSQEQAKIAIQMLKVKAGEAQ